MTPPVHDARTQADGADATREEGQRPTILVVDGDEGLRKGISDLLESEDVQVLSAGDAAEARRLVESEQIDVLLTDLEVPGREGVELIEAARRNNGSPSVILMTDDGEMFERLDLEAKEDIAVLQKPFDAENLLDLVNAEVRRRGRPSPRPSRG